jgi:hypothetical protein
VRLPLSCAHCGLPLTIEGAGARVAHLEYGRALCDGCVYLVEHPESTDAPPLLDDRPAA